MTFAGDHGNKILVFFLKHVMNYALLVHVSTLIVSSSWGLYFYGLYICFLLNAAIYSILCTLIL